MITKLDVITRNYLLMLLRITEKSTKRYVLAINALAKQILNILPAKRLHKRGIISDQFLSQHTLLLLELEDLVFNGVLADHSVGKNIFGLANTVRTINSLLFNS